MSDLLERATLTGLESITIVNALEGKPATGSALLVVMDALAIAARDKALREVLWWVRANEGLPGIANYLERELAAGKPQEAAP